MGFGKGWPGTGICQVFHYKLIRGSIGFSIKRKLLSLAGVGLSSGLKRAKEEAANEEGVILTMIKKRRNIINMFSWLFGQVRS